MHDPIISPPDQTTWSNLIINSFGFMQDLKLHTLSYVNSHGCCCDKAMDGKPRKMALIVGACIMTWHRQQKMSRPLEQNWFWDSSKLLLKLHFIYPSLFLVVGVARNPGKVIFVASCWNFCMMNFFLQLLHNYLKKDHWTQF